jgi:hypothetical protein
MMESALMITLILFAVLTVPEEQWTIPCMKLTNVRFLSNYYSQFFFFFSIL